jgi:hypothetical protein
MARTEVSAGSRKRVRAREVAFKVICVADAFVSTDKGHFSDKWGAVPSCPGAVVRALVAGDCVEEVLHVTPPPRVRKGAEGHGRAAAFWKAAPFLTKRGRTSLTDDAIEQLCGGGADAACFAARLTRSGLARAVGYEHLAPELVPAFKRARALYAHVQRTGNAWMYEQSGQSCAGIESVGHMGALCEHRELERRAAALVSSLCAAECTPVCVRDFKLVCRLTVVAVPGCADGARAWVEELAGDMRCTPLFSDADCERPGGEGVCAVYAGQMNMATFYRYLQLADSRAFTHVLLIGDELGPGPSPELGWGAPWHDLLHAHDSRVPRAPTDTRAPPVLRMGPPTRAFSALSFGNDVVVTTEGARVRPSASVIEVPDATDVAAAHAYAAKTRAAMPAHESVVIVACDATRQQLMAAFGQTGPRAFARGDVVAARGAWPPISRIRHITRGPQQRAEYGRVQLSDGESRYYAVELHNGQRGVDFVHAAVVAPEAFAHTSVDHMLVFGTRAAAVVRAMRTVRRTVHLLGVHAAMLDTDAVVRPSSWFGNVFVPNDVHAATHGREFAAAFVLK